MAGLELDGRPLFRHSLPGRGHGAAVDPQHRHAVVFARRPGSFATIIDLADGRTVRSITAPDDRHFYGHGTYSSDGRWLFASENDFSSGRGVLGVYDAGASYRRTAEIPSGGIGPHEVRLMPDGVTLVVANGGIRTHPDQGRAKLNLSTMTSSLAFIELASGKLLAQARLAPALQKLSIRHLDVDRDGRVAVAMQYEGDRRHRVPLIGLCAGAGPILLLHAPTAVERAMKHYSGSVAFDRSGRWLALTCPRGHLVTLWDARDGDFRHGVEIFDASGVTATGPTARFWSAAAMGRFI